MTTESHHQNNQFKLYYYKIFALRDLENASFGQLSKLKVAFYKKNKSLMLELVFQSDAPNKSIWYSDVTYSRKAESPEATL